MPSYDNANGQVSSKLWKMYRADWVSMQVVEGVRIKQEDEWDEEAWQRQFNALPFMPGVDDAFIKQEEMSDEELWPPEVQQAPPRVSLSPEVRQPPARNLVRQRVLEPAWGGMEDLSRRTKITVVVGDNREYSLEAEYGIFCLGFGLGLVLVLVLVLLLLLCG
jgi:hypothetical protein